MAEQKYGEVEWNDARAGGGGDFMRLEEGNNPVRIFTLPHQFQVCWVKDASGADVKLRTAIKDCPLIKRGEKPQTRWYLGVINRKTNRAEVMEIGTQILRKLKLMSNSEWGNPTGYDVDIVRGPRNTQPLYDVMPKVPKPLSDSDKGLIKAFLEATDLQKMTLPPTAEEVAARLAELGTSHGTGPSNGASQQASRPRTGAPINDDTFNFDDV